MTPKKAAPTDNSEAEANMNEAKKAVLDRALHDIVKRYGEGSIMRLGEAHQMQVDVIPTGSLSLDLALGVGGIPKGRITEIYGPESSGKTTLCQHIVAECQAQGGTAAFIDMEHALYPVYAARCGVNIDDLLIFSPIRVNKRSRSRTRWFVPVQLIWSLSTQLPRLCPALRSRVTWGTRRWASRPD